MWRHVTSRDQICTKLSKNVPFLDILLVSKYEVNWTMFLKVMTFNVFYMIFAIFAVFASFTSFYHILPPFTKHNFLTTYRTKVVDHSLKSQR